MEQHPSHLVKLSDPKYLNVINKWYEQFLKNHKSRKKLETLENELSWFNGMKNQRHAADYQGFYKYVYDHYSPQKMTQTDISSISDKNKSDYPIIFYYILLYSKKYKIFKEYDIKLQQQQEYKNDPVFLQNGFIAYNEWKLLTNLLDNFSAIVAAVIDSIDEENVAYLDANLDSLDDTAIKKRFIKAVSKQEKSMAVKLFEHIKDMSVGETNYFKALMHYAALEYSDALQLAKEVNKEDIDYDSAIALQLECLAYMGEHETFFSLLKEYQQGQYDKSHLIHLLQVLVLNLKDDAVKTFDYESKLDLSKLTLKEPTNTYYVGLTLQTFAKTLVEGILLLDHYLFAKNMNPDQELADKEAARLRKLQLVMTLYPQDIPDFLNIEYVAANPILLCKQQILSAILSMLTKNNPDDSFESQYCAFLCEYQLGFIPEFCDNVNSNLTALIHYYESGDQKAFDLIQCAYIEEALVDKIDDALNAYISKTGLLNENTHTINSDLEDKKLEAFLSDTGKLAMKAAQWQLSKSYEHDSSWKDCSLLSLSFFRILEIEYNKKIILPLVKTIGEVDIERSFNGMIDTLKSNEDAKHAYIKKWGQIINRLQPILEQESNTQGLVLGALNQFILNIGSLYDAHDTLAQAFFAPLFSILNDAGFEALSTGKFEDIISAQKQLEFRNPSVSLKHLTFDNACECRKYVINSLHQLMEWFL